MTSKKPSRWDMREAEAEELLRQKLDKELDEMVAARDGENYDPASPTTSSDYTESLGPEPQIHVDPLEEESEDEEAQEAQDNSELTPGSRAPPPSPPRARRIVIIETTIITRSVEILLFE